MAKFVKNVDVYGVPVSLTYKSEPNIKSTMGGIATILARLIVVIYLGYSCKAVFDKKYTLQTSVIKRDLNNDLTTY